MAWCMVRVLGTSHFVDVRMRELHAAGASDVPRVIAAGYQVRPDVVDAFPDFLLDFPEMMTFRGGLHGADNLRRVVLRKLDHTLGRRPDPRR